MAVGATTLFNVFRDGVVRLRGILTGSATTDWSALELTEAAMFADLTVGLCVLGWLLPFGGLITAAAVAPMAALGARHRVRSVVAGGVCAAVVSLLVGGVGLAANAIGCAVLGGVIGVAERHRWSRTRTLVVAGLTVWPVTAALALIVLLVFGSLRELLLAQVVNTWNGVAHILERLHLGSITAEGDSLVAWLVDHWWFSVAVALLVGMEAALFAAHLLARPTLARLATVPRRRPWSAAPATGDPRPVPLIARDVSFRYPGADDNALDGVSLYVGRGELVAIEGPNGSGKSTLARILAGASPDGGDIERPGAAGIGQPGGTAVVFQRPETQVLGMRVRDDLLWGLAAGARPDVELELRRVGLEGFADRDTSTLSGGELQRLAVASALARRPGLVISDETTAMIDPDGRTQMLSLLRRLSDDDVTVVHITHRSEEAQIAERVIHLDHGRRCDQPDRRDLDPTDTRLDEPEPPGPLLICLRGVGHLYDAGSPWAHRALAGVDLDIGRGDGVLIHGPNGSGKSTLAWILAGLLAPTEGTATLSGSPLVAEIDKLGLSFQHARLQLQRTTVLADVRSAAGSNEETAERALVTVGLDPEIYRDRAVDELSGGQQRRVALAGLLASDPRVLVLDEPFAGLDAHGRTEMIDTLGRLRRSGTTVILVSHDLDGTDRIANHVIQLDHGRVTSDSRPPQSAPPTPTPTSPARPARRELEMRLFRVLPVSGPLHRVSAATKLVALATVATVASLDPQWPTLVITATLVLAGLLVGRVPREAAPRLPRWIAVALAISFTASLAAGGSPDIHVGSLTIGLGAAGDWLRATTLGFTVITAAALVSWTTPLADIPPALNRLTRPLRLVRLPVENWAAVVGLGLRGLPMLLDEIRVLVAARRMRAAHTPPPRHAWRHRLSTPVDLLAASAVTVARRAGEFADAIEARGGLKPTPAETTPLTWRDALVAGAVVLAVVASLLISSVS